MFMLRYTQRPFSHLFTGAGHVSQAMRVKINPGCRFHWPFGVRSLFCYKLHFDHSGWEPQDMTVLTVILFFFKLKS